MESVYGDFVDCTVLSRMYAFCKVRDDSYMSFRVFGLVSVSFAFRFRAGVLSVVEILLLYN